MNLIIIANVAIHRDSNGRYSLNDLHRAAGSREKDAPNRWTRTQEYAGLVEELTPELAFAPADTVRGGSAAGTYVAKELVYAYAMWISPAFHLRVIRAYDALVAAQPPANPLAALNDPVQLRALLLGYDEQVLALKSTVEDQAPKVAALDRIASAKGSCSLTEAAKDLGFNPHAFFEWMRERRWIYRHPLSGTWLAYQPRLDSGVLEHKVMTFDGGDGADRVKTQVRVTAKGLAKLAEVIERERGGISA